MTQPRRKLGLVLGGGGARGLAHAGVLNAFERAGIVPDVLVGVSMGAVIGSVYASRDDWVTALESVDRTKLPAYADFREAEGLQLIRTALESMRRLAPSVWTWGRTGYEEFGRTTLQELLGPAETFADTRIPFAVVTTDVQAGTRAVVTEGNVAVATLASAAIPGLAKPIDIGGRLYIDGGFADPAPVDVARELGADVVVAVFTGQHLEPLEVDNWMLVLMRGLEIGQRAFADERLLGADLVLRPHFGERIRMLNFGAVEDVVRSGYRAGMEAVEAIRDLVGGPAEASA